MNLGLVHELLTQLQDGDTVLVDGTRVVGIELDSDIRLSISNAMGSLAGPFEIVVNENVTVELILNVTMADFLILTNIVFYGREGSVVHTGTPVGRVDFLFDGSPRVLIGGINSGANINLHLQSGSNIEIDFEDGLRRNVALHFNRGPARADLDGFYVEAVMPLGRPVILNVTDGNVILSFMQAPPNNFTIRLYDVVSAASGQRGTITFVSNNELALESIRLRQMRYGWNDLRIYAENSFVGLTDGFFGNLRLVRMR